jgi:hypothetical protein
MPFVPNQATQFFSSDSHIKDSNCQEQWHAELANAIVICPRDLGSNLGIDKNLFRFCLRHF